jgi:glycosyltransferase involved in cell wall biosynthesis
MKDKKIAILIPCYNEEKTIAKVINDFQIELPNATIFVCDNNSTDNTYEIAKENNAIVIKEYNQGKGNAVLNLFSCVKADIYVLVDGDDTYPADRVNTMLDMLKLYNLDMVIGDRLSNGTYKQQNKRKFHNLGNRLIKNLINSFFKANLNDILSGYRVFSKVFIKNYSTLAEGFELETDLSIFALNYNLNIKEVPINYRDRPEGSFSKLNTFKDGFKVIFTFFNLYRFYKPMSFFCYLSLMFFIAALLIGSLPIYEYITFSFVYRVPLAILAASLVIVSLLLLICGLILDTIMRIDKKGTQNRIRNTK